MKRVFACLLMFASAGAFILESTGCACHLAQVYSGTTTTFLLKRDTASLDGAEISACLNGTCSTASVTSIDGGGASCRGGGNGLPPFINCVGSDTDDGVTLTVTLVIDDDDADDGDFYRFVVTAADDPNQVLAEREGEVEYERSEPNGTLCGVVSTGTL